MAVNVFIILVVFATAGLFLVTNSIKGGKKAPYRPFYVSLSTIHESGVIQCGGSVIAPNMVLTAAHCIQGMKHLN